MLRRSLIAALLLFAPAAQAQEAASTSVLALAVNGGGNEADEIERVITNDLQRGGRVRVITPPDGSVGSTSTTPLFPRIAEAGAQFVLPVDVSPTGDGRLRVSFRLFDVNTASQLEAFSLAAGPDMRRRLAHRISDRVAPHLGDAAEFDSRMLIVSEEGRLMIMDGDGANPLPLTRQGVAASPAFVANGSTFAYLRDDSIVLYNLDTNRSETIATGIAANSGIALSRTTDHIAYARDVSGDVDLYVRRLASPNSETSIARPGWQGEASFSTDARRLAFLTEQEGARRIAIAELDSAAVQIVGDAGDYRSLAWSPDGYFFAVVRATAAGEELVLISATGQASPRTLLSAASISRPSWSPSGTMIVVASSGVLNVIDVRTGAQTPVGGGGGPFREAAWSWLMP